jgi:hypothetical protein
VPALSEKNIYEQRLRDIDLLILAWSTFSKVVITETPGATNTS